MDVQLDYKTELTRKLNKELCSIRRKSIPCSSGLEALKARVTGLEIENSILKNNFTVFREKSVKRSEQLEKKIEGLESENQTLMNIVMEMKAEFARLQASLPESPLRRNNYRTRYSQPVEEEETKSNRLSSPIVISSDDDLSGDEYLNQNNNDEFFVEEYTRTPRQLIMDKGKSVEGTKVNDLLKSQELLKAAKSYEPPTLRIETSKFEPTDPILNFLVIGNSQEAVREVTIRPDYNGAQARLLNSQVIFNLAEAIQRPDAETVTPPGIEDLITPRGIKIRRLPSVSQEDDFFQRVILKMTRSHKKRFVCPLNPHSENVANLEWEDTVKTINPQRKLYAFCIRKKDFWHLSGEKKSKDLFLQTSVIYCILTYYPYPELMFNILASILNIIRKKRKDRYFNLPEKHREPVSLSIHNHILLHNVVPYLRSFMGVPAPSFGGQFEYLFTDKNNLDPYLTRYRYPTQMNGHLELSTWKSTAIFSMLGLLDIQLILSAILLDKQVVFFSENATLLTAAINTFIGLLHPLKYINQIIPILSCKRVIICKPASGMALPSIIGIQRKEEYFHRKELKENLTALFVFLDSKTIFRNEKNDYISKFSTLDFVNEHLENIYRQINTGGTGFQVITKYSLLNTVHTGYGAQRNLNRKNKRLVQILLTENAMSNQIFNEIRTWMKNNVVNYLEILKPGQKTDTNLKNYEKEINDIIKNENTNKFFQEFKRARGFINYPY